MVCICVLYWKICLKDGTSSKSRFNTTLKKIFAEFILKQDWLNLHKDIFDIILTANCISTLILLRTFEITKTRV